MKHITFMCTWVLLALVALSGFNSADAEETIRVNFARTTTPTIDGWYADHGAPYADRGNGLSYGWNGDNSTTARQRNAALSPDLQHDTLVHLQKPELPQAVWEISVPNGRYVVTLLAGDPGYTDSNYLLAAEGVVVIDHQPTSAARWAEGSVAVLVLDGRLTISSAAGAQNNKLCSVVIEPLPMTLQVDFTQLSPAAGWLADSGAAFADRGNGLSYGWQGAEPTLIATGSSDSSAVWSAAMNGGQWEIAVPNGIYDITVVAAGEPDVVRAHDLMIEGLYQPDTAVAAASTTLTTRVSVADGRLTIAAAPGAIAPALAAINLARVDEVLGADDGLVHGLLGSWYDTEHFTNRKRLAVDPQIGFYWGGLSPWPGMDGTYFTTRWQGSLVADVSAVHNLRFRFNESVRLWIDGELVIDAWYAHKDWHDEYVDYAFTAGEAVPVVIEYRQRSRSSGIYLSWKPSPGVDSANNHAAYTRLGAGNYLPPVDGAAPSVPEDVYLSYLSPTRIQVSWAPSSDDVDVLGYHVYRDGLRVATLLHETLWVDEGVDPIATYSYTIEAIDWNGTRSALSQPADTWYPLTTAATDITSHTSPAWIEGNSAPATQAIDIAVDGAAAIPALRLGDDLWGTDAQNGKPYGIDLQQGTPSAVQVTAHGPNGELATIDLTATWTPLILSAAENPASFALRAGDTLLLDVAEATGTAVVYDVGDNGMVNVTGTAGSPVTLTFDNSAITPVRAIADLNNDGVFDAYTETVAVLEVTALAVDFDGPIASEVGFRREKGVEVYPLEAANTPVWDSNDASLLEVAVIPDDQLSDEVMANPDYNPANYGKRLWLRATRRGTPVLLARTPSGALVGFQEVDEFTLESDDELNIVVNNANQSGSIEYIMRPYIPDLDFHLSIFSHESTFEGGSTDQIIKSGPSSMEITANPLTGENIGKFKLAIEVPSDEESYCFSMEIDQESQHGTRVGFRQVNGGVCRFDVERIYLCHNDRKAQTLQIIEHPDNAEPNHHARHHSISKNEAADPFVLMDVNAPGPVFDCINEDTWRPTVSLIDNPAGGQYDIKISGTLFEDVVQVFVCDIDGGDANRSDAGGYNDDSKDEDPGFLILNENAPESSVHGVLVVRAISTQPGLNWSPTRELTWTEAANIRVSYGNQGDLTPTAASAILEANESVDVVFTVKARDSLELNSHPRFKLLLYEEYNECVDYVQAYPLRVDMDARNAARTNPTDEVPDGSEENPGGYVFSTNSTIDPAMLIVRATGEASAVRSLSWDVAHPIDVLYDGAVQTPASATALMDGNDNEVAFTVIRNANPNSPQDTYPFTYTVTVGQFSGSDKVNLRPIRAVLSWDGAEVSPGDIVAISDTPTMPELIGSIRPRFANDVKWQLVVKYKKGNRDDVTYFPGPGPDSWAVRSGNENWTVPWGDLFVGGDATIRVDIFDAIREYDFKIYGITPPKSRVKDRLVKLRFQMRGWVESRFTQFANDIPDATSYDSEPKPVLHALDNGMGVMQLTSGPTPTIKDLWNWQTNVDNGLVRLRRREQEALAYNDQVQQGLPITGVDEPPNIGTAYPAAPEFTENQLDLEVWARYNSNYRYHDYNPDLGAWVPRNATNPTALENADNLNAVQNSYMAGNLPAGW